MRNHRCLSVTRAGCLLAAAVCVAAGLADAGAAGQGRRPPGNPDIKREQREREQREAALRTTEARAVIAKLDQKRVETAVKQLREDFKQIQVLRNEIARNLLAGKPLDYKLVTGEAEDINKRAGRLKSYLMPPTPADKEQAPKSQVEFGGDEMQDALIRLCNLIDSFVENPVLKTPGTTDVEQSVKAGGDLLSIIELSGNIKRSAEKLNKTPR